MSEPRFPGVKVRLTGMDGNVFGLIGKVTAAMKAAGLRNEAKDLAEQAFKCDSYGSVLRLLMGTVVVS